jgi:hypothetical protein
MTKTIHDSETPAIGKQVFVACAFIHYAFDGIEKVFLAQRAESKKFYPGVFEIPGGHIDFGEEIIAILLANAGLNPDEWLPLVVAAKAGMGVNVAAPAKLVDLKSAGIVDPARVTKEALLNAVSIAGTAMTMGALVVEVPEKKDAPAGPDMGGMM